MENSSLYANAPRNIGRVSPFLVQVNTGKAMSDTVKSALAPRQILRTFNSTPSRRFLKNARSQFQIEQWARLHRNSLLTALAWVSHQEHMDNLLADLMSNGLITQNEHDYAWGTAFMYLDFWSVCQQCARFLKAECELQGVTYPFSSAYELFTHAVRECGDYEFSLCLQYQELSARKLETAIRLLRQSLERELTKSEEKKILGAAPSTTVNVFWHPLILHVAEKYSERSFPLKVALERWKTTARQYLGKGAKRLRTTRSIAISPNGITPGSKCGYKQGS